MKQGVSFTMEGCMMCAMCGIMCGAMPGMRDGRSFPEPQAVRKRRLRHRREGRQTERAAGLFISTREKPNLMIKKG